MQRLKTNQQKINKKSAQSTNNDQKNEDQISKINISEIQPNQKQPRKNFKDEELKELSSSIKNQGLIHPIIVKPIIDNQFQIIAGERRWRACQLNGMHEVECVIKELDDTNVLEAALIENIQRENLNPVEAAMAIKDLIEKYNFSNEQLIKVTGKKRASISNTLRILELPKKVLNSIIEGKISRGHAIALLALGSENEIIKIAEQIIMKNLSVRDIEKIG